MINDILASCLPAQAWFHLQSPRRRCTCCKVLCCLYAASCAMLPALAGCSIALNTARRCQTRHASSDASSGHSTSYVLHHGAGPPVNLLSGCICLLEPLSLCRCLAGNVSAHGVSKGPEPASRAMAAASRAITGLSASRAPSFC